VFGTPIGKRNILSGWMRTNKPEDPSFQWAASEKTAVSLNWYKPETLYLHVKLSSFFPNAVQVQLNGKDVGKLELQKTPEIYTVELPAAAMNADKNIIEFVWHELRELPNAPNFPKVGGAAYLAFITPAKNLEGDPLTGLQNAVNIPSRISIAGKTRLTLASNIGSVVRFYEKLNKNATLQFGTFYDAPTTAEEDDFVNFDISLQREGEKEQVIFQKRTDQEFTSKQFIDLSKYIHSSQPELYKIEFHIKRNSVLDTGKAAWVEPVLNQGVVNRPKFSGTNIEKIREANENANVMIVLLDAAGAKHLSAYGYHRETTPNIDALARVGIKFEKAYCQAVYTLASTASLMSGLDPYRHHVTQKKNKLPENIITIAERFLSAGYQTGVFTANGNAGAAFGMTQGFQEANEVYRQPGYTGWASDVSKAFIQWLETRDKKRPFFVYLHYREPHGPFNPPAKFKNIFTDPNYNRFQDASDEMRRKLRTGEITETQADRDFITAAYDENLHYGDYEFGSLIKRLKALNLYDRTILLVIADHGEAFWEHDFQGHNSQLYEESTRIPYILKLTSASGIKNKTIKTPVRTIDIYPSLVDLLHLSRRNLNVDGHSFLPYLTSNDTEDVPVFSQTLDEDAFSISEGQFKYIYHRIQGTDELYDLKSDPDERKNLNEALPIVRGYMRSRIFGWQRSVKAAETQVATK
jgi:arylsulfatase